MGTEENTCEGCDAGSKKDIPAPPPLPAPPAAAYKQNRLILMAWTIQGNRSVAIENGDLWDRLFDEGYRADVLVKTENGGVVYAHASILGMASPVINGMLKRSKRRGKRKTITIRGVPDDAVRVFIRFLYSSRYEKEEIENYIIPLLVLSHVFVVPQLKRECAQQLERGMINTENVIDFFQLALLCDAPRLSLICYRMILKNLKAVSATEAWKAMRESHPVLEKDLLRCLMEDSNMQNERIKKKNEKKIYLQLYEAMEALVHICRDGCQTIGPHDKALNKDQPPCNYETCKGLEQLVRHFAGCKLRVPGGCIHCKRMWQLLELHSRLCADSELCRVPLCRIFKGRIKKQNKKEEKRWRILARNILRTKNIGGAPFFSWERVICS